ncbi:enoyl-CoA hydratase-related protein [Candidatus Borrarchaeum sp.]|uniref:enoyl-CoA hydratase/isomerase family protein n=1 Tax=Candidatus Borrarchaeum sp. TaxID=2846742 RepID=UPI00318424DD
MIILNSLKYEAVDKIGIITINRPNALNAFNKDVIDKFDNLLDEIGNDGRVKVVIITGEGERAFCTGADLAGIKNSTKEEFAQFIEKGQMLMRKIETMKKPFIAAINGFALGGGLELALACDIRIASENAKLGTPEVGVGLIPGWGATQRLPKVIGLGRAKELILTGNHISAKDAERLGLVNKVVTFDELIPSANKIAEKIANNAPIAVQLAKAATNVSFEGNIEEGYKHELEAEKKCFETEDLREGIQALFDKRKPNFAGN